MRLTKSVPFFGFTLSAVKMKGTVTSAIPLN